MRPEADCEQPFIGSMRRAPDPLNTSKYQHFFAPHTAFLDPLNSSGCISDTCRTTALFLIALFSDWVGNTAILVAIFVSTAVNAYLAVGMLNGLPSSQRFFNTLHPYWVQPFVTIIFAVAAYLAEACARTTWAKRTSAWLHSALHGKDDLDKVSASLASLFLACCSHHQHPKDSRILFRVSCRGWLQPSIPRAIQWVLGTDQELAAESLTASCMVRMSWSRIHVSS